MADGTIHIGDCRDILPTLPAGHADAIVTDPPYELGFMGKDWDASGVAFDLRTWRAALQATKPGGYLLAFGGTRTFHRMICAIEDAGWEIRDTLMWLYGSGFPKSHNGPWGGTALKPAWEPIILARKPIVGTVAANHAQHGTGGLNIDDCGIGAKFTEGGRWPANLIHDGSDDVRAAFPDAKGQQGDLNQQAHAVPQGNAFGQYGPKRAHAARIETDTSAARFFYCAKASRTDRTDGLHGLTVYRPGERAGGRAEGSAGLATAYAGTRSAGENNHPTVKPTELMRWLVRLVTPAGGVVLDPFTGSGSTGRAAIAEGMQFVGIELDPDYAAIAEARMRTMQPGLALGVA